MYHIEWRDLAAAELAEGWTNADSQLRADITTVVHEIEHRLSVTPDIAGESREPGTRVLVTHPLTVTFHVNIRTSTVLITGVRVSRRRRK